MTRCERCGEETAVYTCSMFNTETICLGCKEVEEAHPGYEEARRVEGEAVLAGNFNFPGVGLPDDLRGGAS